jgi:uncharacterized membrane protein YcaP (DUF421 family)
VVLLELIFRTSFMFGFSILMFRLMGARTLSQLSMPEIVLIIGLGAAVGDPMMYTKVPLAHGMIVITVVVVLQRLLTLLTARFRGFADMVEPRPLRVVHNGRVDERGRKMAGLSHNELYGELRKGEAKSLSQVERAYMEPDGNFSIFLTDEEPPANADDLIHEADQHQQHR